MSILSSALSIAAVLGAAVAAVVVGRRRGIDQVDDRADSEVKRLVDAQAARLAILEAENRRLTDEVKQLTATVATLRADLDIERRVTKRERQRAETAEADGR